MTHACRLPAATSGPDDAAPARAVFATVEAAAAAAHLAETRLRQAIDALPQGIVFLDAEGRYLLWNESYAQIYKASADLLAPGARLADTLRIGVARGDYPEALGREEEWLGERLALLENPGSRHEQRLADGRCILIEERKTNDGGTIGLRVDITDLKHREDALHRLFEENPMPLFVYDPDGDRIRWANLAAHQHYGWAAGALADASAKVLFDENEWHEARCLLQTTSSDKQRVWRQRRADGVPLESVLFTRPARLSDRLSDSRATIVSVFDVTERRHAEARMAWQARHDELTGLTNRTHCRELLEALLAGESHETITVALVDLDHFKAVNDTYGHWVGDLLLAEAARRMAGLLPPGATLCRIGGDEFALVVRGAAAAEVEQAGRAMIAALSQPFELGSHLLHIGATIGTAAAPVDARDQGTLMRYADLALYAAKAERRGSLRRFEPAMDHAAQRRSRLETHFREAVREGRLQVYYQPLINLASDQIEGYEALLRWEHPEYGTVSPDVFIPLAEEMGLIDTVGAFVLQTACRAARAWPDHVTLSVNVSPLQFRHGGLLNTVLQALSGSELPPARLELEITEAVLMERSTRTSAVINSLRALGVGLSMDDFGTGYSSLRYLLSYPFTKIKIDRSFVTSLDAEANSRAVIKAVIGLGQSLGLKVTAEGIEDESVRDYLRDEGCYQGQGYLFGRAAPAEDLSPESRRRDVA